jgi:hypothetical protein
MRDRVIPESNCGLTPLIPGQRDAGSTRTSTRKTFALEWVINVVVQLTIAAWLALEAGLIIRDRVRRKGSAARDRGTLWLNIIIITAAGRGASGDVGRAGPREGRLADTAHRPRGHVLPRGARPAVSRATLSPYYVD